MTDIQQIPFKALEPCPLNPRTVFDEDFIEQLSASIGDFGIQQNLVARPKPKGQGGFEIIMGEQRFQAFGILIEKSERSRDDTLPVKVFDCDDAQVIKLGMVENLQRKGLHPMDEAEGYAALRELGMAIAEIAGAVPYTKRHVELRLQLADNLVPMAKAAFRAGEMELAQARALAAYAPSKRQGKAVELIQKGDWNYEGGERLKQTLREDLVPVGRNIFQQEDYKGEIRTDPDEPKKQFFSDVDEFNRLQAEAVGAKHEELYKEWAWVEIKRGGYFYRGDYGRSKDKSVAGALIHLDTRGQVEIYTELLKPADARKIERAKAAKAREASGEPAKPKVDVDDPEKQLPTKAGLNIARREKTHALRRALMDGGPEPAMICVIMALMRSDAVRLRISDYGFDGAEPTPEITAALNEGAEILKGCEREWGDRLSPKGWAEAFKRLVEAAPEVTDRLFTAHVAACLVNNSSNAQLGDKTEAALLAAELGADPAVGYSLGAEYLETCSKAGLVRLAEDLELTFRALGQIDDTPIGRKALEKMTGKALRAALLEHLANHPDKAECLPFPFRYGTQLELLDAAKKKPEPAPAKKPARKTAAKKPARKTAAKKPAKKAAATKQPSKRKTAATRRTVSRGVVA